MNIKAWPFLVSRNQYLDYRTVVAPSFMIQAGNANLLARAAGGKLTQPGHAIYREINGSQESGNIALIFRVVEIFKNEIYSNQVNEKLKDPFGREVFFIEGIVLEKNTGVRVKVTHENLDKVHKQLLECYRKFWEHSDPFQAPVQPLEHLELQIDYKASQIVMLDEMEPFIIKTKASTSIEKYKSFKCVYSEDIKKEISSVTFSPDGNLLAVKYNQVVMIWNWGKRQRVCNLGQPLDKFIKNLDKMIGYWTGSSISFNRNGHLLASSMVDFRSQEFIKLWDINTQKVWYEFKVHGLGFGRILSLAFSPVGDILAYSSKNKKIKFWNIDTKQEIQTLDCNSPARSISVSPDNRFLVSGDEEGKIKVWNIETGDKVSSIQAYSSSVSSVAFSSDGQTLASVCHNDCDNGSNKIRIWNIDTQGNINTKNSMPLSGHKKQVNSIAFSPNGQTLVSGSNDCDIKLWNLRTRKTVCTLCEHTDAVTSVAFSPDGQTLASGSKDGMFKIWQ